MHDSYYSALLSLLEKGDVERKTKLSPFSVSLFQNGEKKYGKDSADWDKADITETIKAEPHIVLFGGGHIAKAIGDFASILSMKVTVIDEREELLTEERFPYAERIKAESYASFLSSGKDFFRPFYVIVTHGHLHDRECLEWCLNKSYSYLGMIGSKTKVAATFDYLEKKGWSPDILSTVHAPIGLKIGAVTPEEIALSICAEITGVFRSTKNSLAISPEYLKTVSSLRGISARIIEKKGSAPRSVGSELFLSENNKIYGTVGGGSVEKKTIEIAREMLKSNEEERIVHFSLSSEGDVGMICGGDVTILFTKIV